MIKILYFYGEHCPQCAAAKGPFEAEIKRLNIEADTEFINSEEAPEMTAKYNIRSIPTVVVERDGEIVDRGHALVMIPKLKELR